MNAKIRKLGDQFNEEIERSSSESTIFSGVAIFVNGYTS